MFLLIIAFSIYLHLYRQIEYMYAVHLHPCISYPYILYIDLHPLITSSKTCAKTHLPHLRPGHTWPESRSTTEGIETMGLKASSKLPRRSRIPRNGSNTALPTDGRPGETGVGEGAQKCWDGGMIGVLKSDIRLMIGWLCSLFHSCHTKCEQCIWATTWRQLATCLALLSTHNLDEKSRTKQIQIPSLFCLQAHFHRDFHSDMFRPLPLHHAAVLVDPTWSQTKVGPLRRKTMLGPSKYL